MFAVRLRIALVIAGIALIATACDSRSFPDAPSATAPEPGEAETSAAETPPMAGPSGRRQNSGSQDLPPDHPPVGAGGGQMGSSQTGSNQGSGSGVQPPTQGPQGMSPAQFGKVGPLRWQAPDSWRAVKPASNMRLAEYHLPAEQGGEPATLTAFYFGKGGGGSIQANIDRWVGQFEKLSGEPKQTTQTSNGLNVHLVDATGTFNVGAAMGGGQAQAGWRMRGAIVESPAGNFFFKLTGPESTVAAHEDGFASFVSSFRAADGAP